MGWLIELLPFSYTVSVVVLGAAIIGITAGVLGTFAVLRERSLVGDAISHAALPGVCAAFLLTGAKDATTLLVGATVAGVLGALLMVGIERTSRIRPDAAIGVVLSTFFSVGIVLLTYIGNRNDAGQAGLERYLFGQAAGLLERDLEVMFALGAIAIIMVVTCFRMLKTTLFDPGFAGAVGLPVRLLEVAMTALIVVAVVVGVRAVGAILMVAMLIAPAVAARQMANRLRFVLPLAGLIGAGIGIVGAVASARTALPAGPVIVVVGFAAVLTGVLFAPGRGVLWHTRGRAARRRRSRTERVLLEIETAMHAGPPPTLGELHELTGRSRWQLRRTVAWLDRAGLVAYDRVPAHGDIAPRLRLSESGAAAAHALIERRELWSAWLEHGWRLELPDAREPDPSDLRGSLGDELADQLSRHVATTGEETGS